MFGCVTGGRPANQKKMFFHQCIWESKDPKWINYTEKHNRHRWALLYLLIDDSSYYQLHSPKWFGRDIYIYTHYIDIHCGDTKHQ